MKISVCIPMYNENKIIERNATILSEYMKHNFEDYEIIFCNDGSHDGCDKTVMDLHLPCVKVIGYEQNQGKGRAVRTAMLAANGDIRIFTDADLAYGTDVIKQIVQAFEQQTPPDIVIGSRNLEKNGYEGYTWFRKVVSKLYIKVLCFVGGFHLSDSQCGCKAFSGNAANEIFSRCEVDRFAFDFEAILWAEKFNYRFFEIPVRVINHGESKVHVIKDTMRMLKDLKRMRKRIKNYKI